MCSRNINCGYYLKLGAGLSQQKVVLSHTRSFQEFPYSENTSLPCPGVVLREITVCSTIHDYCVLVRLYCLLVLYQALHIGYFISTS